MKGKKIIVSALVATMVGAPAAVLNSATNNVFAEDFTNDSGEYTVVGPNIWVENNYKKTVKQGVEVTIPEVLHNTGSNPNAVTEVRVIDPNGKDITTTITGDEEKTNGLYHYRLCPQGLS